MAQNIEIPVSLGLQAAEGQVSHLRKILTEAVKIDSTSFRGLSQALQKAETDVAKLKSQMSTAFQSASGSKKFLSDYDKLFESLATIGNRFNFLKESEMIFSPENAEVIKNARAEMAQLSDEIQQIKSGKVGKLFEDDSVASIKEVREVANDLGVTLSKTTFQDFGQKISGAMTNVKKDLDDTRKQIELLKEAAKSADLKKDSIFSQLNIDKLMGNTAEVLDKNGAKTLRGQIAKLYEEYGLTDVELGKNIKAGSNIDQIFIAEEERIRASSEKYVGVLQEQKNKIQEEIDKFDEGLKQSGGDGKRANWETKLAYIDEIKQKFAGLLTFSDVPASVSKDGTGITKYIESFKQELINGMKDLSTDDIARVLQEKVQVIFSNASTKSAITDLGSFKQQITVMMKETFGDLNLGDVTSGISVGWDFDKAIEMVVANIKAALQNLDPKELEGKAAQYEATLKKLENASKTVGNTERASTGSLKEKEAAFQALAEEVTKYVAAQLGITTGQVQAALRGDADAANQGRTALEGYIQSLDKLSQKQQALGNIQMAVNRWMGFWQVLNMTKSAINDMKQHIQELDTVMTSISVVTNFSQDDLWGQISQYSEIARQYGVAIKGVYEVSQIYYQQGLQQNDVMTLTTETLKMARIAGLDYATAADYMTTAIRGFKLEMTDAAHVTDVFSALAATTASSTEEIATAISKTASSAEAVGASFEATSAMMATMIATTRESATNIGTALKSVISRYGEMTSDPSKTVDSEGEEMSLNRVDKALQTVGITIHDTAGQFRDFDDVMLELMEKWDSLDSLSQRYIATLMAGNRQQSRFLALVSNVDEYKKALETAMDSEGAGELQTLKTLDSIDAKIEKMKVTIQEFYTSSGIEELYKSILDSITNIVSAANSLPKAFEKIPLAAIAMGGSIISAVKSAIKVILGEIQAGLEMMKGNTQSTMTGLISMMAQGGRESGKAYREAQEAEMNGSAAGKSGLSKSAVISGTVLRYAGAALNIASAVKTLQGMNAYGASSTKEEDQSAATQVRTGGILGILGSAASGAATGTMISPGWGTAIGAGLGILKGVAENIATLTSASEMYNVSLARQIELSGKRLEADKQEQLEAKNTEKQLEQAYTKLKELEEHQYDSVEAQQEYHDYMNQLADSYPAYVEKIDQANNAIIYSGTLEEELARARELTAAATRSAIEAELDKADLQQKSINNFKQGLAGIYGNDSDITSLDLEGIANLVRKSFSSDIDNFNNEKFIAGLTEEEAAEYLVKAYAARTPQNIPGYDRKNRTTVGGTLLPSGDFIKTSYRQILNTRDGNGLTLLDKIMSDSELNLGAGEDAREAARTQFKSLLTDLLAESEKAGQSVSLATITKNKNIENVDDILSLTDTEFTNAVSEAKQWADSLSKTTAATKQGIRTALIDAQAREKVTTQINTLENKQDKVLAEQYKDLITYGMSAKFGQDIDTIDSNQFNEAFTKLSDWIKNNQESAEALANIDYSQYTTFDKLKESIENFGDLDDKIESQIESDFNEARTNAVTLYTNQLTDIFSDGKAPDWLTDTDQFTNRTLTAIQFDLKQYQSLIEKQQYAQAEAYFHNMEAIYGEDGFGRLTDEQQTQAYDVIKDLDLSDPEALHSAAETLANMGIGFKGLSDTLINAASRWTTSAATLLEQLASSTKDTAKSIESSIADMSKVFKYSEALEKAQALMDANEGIKFNELFTYDKDLGGYIKTSKAFQLEMAEFQNQQIEDIQQAITDTTVILPKALKSLNYNRLAADYAGSKNADQNIAERSRKEGKQTLSSLIGITASADLDRLWIQYNQMMQEFDALEETDKDWNIFVDQYIQEHGQALQLQLDEINNMSSQMAQLQLKSFDYTSIVGGKGTAQTKETLKALIQASLKDNTQFDFNTFWTNLITGQIDNANEALAKADLGQISKGQANRARFEGLTSLYDKIASGDVVWDALTEQEQELLNSVEGVNLTKGASARQVGAAADNVWAAIIKLIQAGAGTLKEVADTIAGKADKAFKNSNAGKQYDLLTSYKDGFTSSEAEELGLLNNDGTLKAEFASYLERDSNGNWVAAAGQNAAGVIQNLARLLNISIDKTTDEYKDAIKDGIDQAIANADKADIGKQRVNAWQSIMSGKVSDRISLADVDATARSYMQAAGLISDMNADFVYIQSEEQLNNAIEWMRDKLSDQSFVQGNQQTARYFQQLVSDFEAKTAKNAAFEGIIGEQFNQSAAEALSMALQNTTEYSKVQSLMTEMGFKWDQAAQVWKASAESIKATRAKINTAYGTGQINREEFLHLQASLDATAKAIDPKAKQDNALLEILQNYNAVTDEMLATFATEFHIPRNSIKNFIKANDNGTYDIDLGALTSYLNSIGFEYDEAARSEIEAITDSYLSNIQTAATYSTQGASSLADIEAFRQSYADIVHESLDANAFQYDSLTQSFMLDPAAMHKYVDAQKEILTGMGYTEEFVNAYITDQTDKAIQASIELDSFLNANTNKSRNDEANKLIQQIRGLSNYKNLFSTDTLAEKFSQGGWSETISEQYDQLILETLESGGQAAIDLLKKIKPDASSDELEAAFNSQINKLNDVMSQVDDLVVGQFVGTEGKLHDVLARAGAVDDNGVVAKGFSMVKVYAAIYAEMSETAGKTTAGLNDAYAKLLTAQDQTNIDITEALQNGNGMSYTDFGNLLAKYDIKFEDYMTDHWDTVMRDGFGNIRITDWNAFAESIWKDNLDQVKNTQEYTSAFKAYNDGLIELNQNAEDAIVEEIQSISGAKGGDWLNMTTLWSGLQSIVSAAISNITPQDYKGNVDLANRPIVPAEKMKEVFAGFEDDYATLYSESFMSQDFGDFSKNAGMLFTTISASGEIVGDLYSYVKALYDEAAGDTDRMRELDKISNGGKGLMLFGELFSSYEKLDQYAQDLHDRGAAKDTIGYYLQVLKQYDATLENGILKLGDKANMFGVASTIRDLIDASGIEITNGLAEIQDAIQEVLKSYAEAITKGIQGGLTNAEVDDLNAKAQDFGITDLQFTETADGFQLAETSAIQLYSALKSIDALHAEQAFDALSESLEKSNEHFKTTGALMAHITSIRKDLYSADDKISNARKAQYEAELAVAEEILAVRSTTEDESFKFMDQAIPAGQNNPLNYWEGWQKAFNAINESKKTKRMDYTDFYNLMTEMGNLSTMLGGKGIQIGKDLEVNSQNYTDLITQAARNLTSTASDTDLKVNLPAINVDFSSAENMVGDVQKGIQAVADEQIDMLDGLIAMLETVVAMEKLGDVAGGGDTPDEIDLGDIFPEITWDENGNAENLEAITAYDKDYQGFLDWIEVQRGKNKNLNDALNQLKVNGMSLSDIFGLSAHDLAAKGKEFNQAYVAFLEGMRKAALSGNYDVDNIMASVQQVLAESGITDLTIDTGKSTMIIKGGVVTTLDWETPETQTILAEVDANTEKAKELITQAMENYLAGKESGNKVTLEQILKLRHHILVNDEGVEYIQVTTPDGKDKVFANDTNDNHWLAAQAEKQLEDMGLDPHKLTKEEYEGGYAQTTTTIGNINNIQVRAEGGEVSFNADGSATAEGPDGKQIKLHGSSQQEVINNFVEDYKNKEKKLNISTEKMLSEAKIQWKLGIRASLAATIVNDQGKGVDFANEPAIRKEIEKFVNEGLSTDKFTPDGKGNYNVEIADLTYTISGASIETDGKLDLAKAAETLLTSTGLDLSLSRTITQGIADAIPSLTSALSSLDPNPAQKVADAIKQIGDNAQTAITRIASLAQNLKGLPQQKESNGSKNSGTGAGAHEPETITGEVSIEGTEKAEQDMNSFSSTIGSLGSTVQSAATSASAAASSMASRYSQAMSDMNTKTQDAAGSTRQHLEELAQAAVDAVSTLMAQIGSIPTHISITSELTFTTPDGKVINTKGGYRSENGKVNITVEGQEQIQEVKDKAAEPIKMTIDATADPAISVLNELIAKIQSTSVEASVNLSSQPSQIQSQINSRTYTASVQLQPTGGLVPPRATGNLGLAQAKGTLMGELGPELVVSNGRYFVAGQNGAEMVNLADDAIVFNHLQTEQLLKYGMSSGRGKAVTSEKNAVAFATGNTGPAMASASAALNALKQLRAMWESLRSASVSDLAGAGGGGGGGGGDKAVDPSIWIDTVERWYNLMQKIAKLEKEITHEETLRSKLESDWNANGNHYYASQKRSLEALRDQIDAQEQLNLSRQAYYDQRVEALEKSPFGKLIRFDDEGQMFFQEGAMEWLTKLAGFDSEGKANYTDEEKYDILMKAGYGDYMKYDSNGGEIKKDGDGDGEATEEELQTFYGNATKAFWDRIDDYKETTQSLWDSIKDGEDSLLDLQADQNGLLEEIRENQMEVEDQVLKAIEDLRQREIDALQDERDKLEESTQKYIEGLTDALNREQEMYQNQEDETNLNQQRRRLAILQRSGGSAEDIASLRSEIDSSERERYFNLQQQQIDAIQAASDLEIERMDSQIEIMTETLEYQKEYGLLWGNVYAVMQESSEKIVSFITHGNSEFWTSSALASKTAINEQLFAAQQWTSYRDDLAAAKASIGENGVTAKNISENVQLMATITREQMKDNDYRIFDEAMKKEFGNDYDKNGAYKDIFYSEYQEHGDLTKVTASARKKYSDDKKAAEAAKTVVEATKPSTTTTATSSPDSSGDSGSSSDNHKLKRTPYWVSDGSSGCHQVAEYTDGTLKGATQPHNLVNGKCSRCGWTTPKTNSIAEFVTGSNDPETVLAAGKGPLNTTPGSAEPWINQIKINTPKVELPAPNDLLANPLLRKIGAGHKASGGYVNHGVYELGELGTETVLTASQTKVLRDNILSNRPNSLISLLRSYNENYDGINSSLTGITPVEDNSVTIERVEMTMEVKQIANDYDAKRAGEQALNEMMRIARKTGATNSIRR